ncbi:MAG: hypothetical protein IKN55_00110 [Oscillospiraceae bacterium]|nr:hypothetical protein [Oscillospiraceae bacterium]
MELIVIPKGSGKYTVTDEKDRKIYTVNKKRKLIGNPITSLHDASGYVLYTMVRTASGNKPAFDITFNDAHFLDAKCKSLFVDPSITFDGPGGQYLLKGKDTSFFTLQKGSETIGSLKKEKQANDEPMYLLSVDDKYFDDFIPLFAVVADKCYNT